jgi:hypothetical protein
MLTYVIGEHCYAQLTGFQLLQQYVPATASLTIVVTMTQKWSVPTVTTVCFNNNLVPRDGNTELASLVATMFGQTGCERQCHSRTMRCVFSHAKAYHRCNAHPLTSGTATVHGGWRPAVSYYCSTSDQVNLLPRPNIYSYKYYTSVKCCRLYCNRYSPLANLVSSLWIWTRMLDLCSFEFSNFIVYTVSAKQQY